MSTVLKTRKMSQSPKSIVAIPYKVIQGLIAKKVSGKLTIEDPNDISIVWVLYLNDGKINFATSQGGKIQRIVYILTKYYPGYSWEIPQQVDDDYQFFEQLYQNKLLTKEKYRQILWVYTQEALIQCLSLSRAKVSFSKENNLGEIVLNASIKKLVNPIKRDISLWAKQKQSVSSPFIRPVIQKWPSLQYHLINKQTILKKLEKLKPYFNDECTLYEIAEHSEFTTLELATIITPLIKEKLIIIKTFKDIPVRRKPVVACIDDSAAIQRVVKMTLIAGGFEVVSITEPALAISSFVRKKPDLILMDINMPNIDGYKLSYMIRQSTLLADIPILMLTGRDGVLDRVKAKMVGAVGYVSKPFEPQELIKSINEHMMQNKI